MKRSLAALSMLFATVLANAANPVAPMAQPAVVQATGVSVAISIPSIMTKLADSFGQPTSPATVDPQSMPGGCVTYCGLNGCYVACPPTAN